MWAESVCIPTFLVYVLCINYADLAFTILYGWCSLLDPVLTSQIRTTNLKAANKRIRRTIFRTEKFLIEKFKL